MGVNSIQGCRDWFHPLQGAVVGPPESVLLLKLRGGLWDTWVCTATWWWWWWVVTSFNWVVVKPGCRNH